MRGSDELDCCSGIEKLGFDCCRAVETALEGQADCASARSLTLDGDVKCYQGRLPPSSLLEKFENLEHLSIANIGVSSLENFPHLRNLQRLILSDNRIAGGLEFLVAAGLESLRDLDLSNNRIQSVEDLEPLARLQLVSLDLYECPVMRVRDYRSKVFGLIRSLKYLDKMDVEENERPESDEEEEEEEDDDPGSGEIDGEDRNGKMSNGRRGSEGVLYVDEDEESDVDEEETETEAGARVGNGSTSHSNGFTVAGSIDGDEEYEDVEEEDEDDLGEEIDEEEGEDEEVVEVQEIDESGDEEDGVEEDENGEEEVDDDNEENPEPGVRRRELVSTDGEIDGHDHEEDDDENGGIGKENGEGLEDVKYEDDGEDEDDGAEFLVQPIGQVEGDSDAELDNAEDEADEDVEDGDEHDKTQLQQPSSSHSKWKRDGGGDEDDESIVDAKSRKHH